MTAVQPGGAEDRPDVPEAEDRQRPARPEQEEGAGVGREELHQPALRLQGTRREQDAHDVEDRAAADEQADESEVGAEAAQQRREPPERGVALAAVVSSARP